MHLQSSECLCTSRNRKPAGWLTQRHFGIYLTSIPQQGCTFKAFYCIYNSPRRNDCLDSKAYPSMQGLHGNYACCGSVNNEHAGDENNAWFNYMCGQSLGVSSGFLLNRKSRAARNALSWQRRPQRQAASCWLAGAGAALPAHAARTHAGVMFISTRGRFLVHSRGGLWYSGRFLVRNQLE